MNISSDDDTHKEIVEIKSELKEVRQTQDSEVHLQRKKWEDHLDSVLDDNIRMVRLLLLVDGTKSGKRLLAESVIPKVTCWRMLNKLENGGVIMKLDKTDNGSPIYKVSRWFKLLRLDDYIRKKYPQADGEKEATTTETIEQQGADSIGNSESSASENQSS
jgi:hypothetical protein